MLYVQQSLGPNERILSGARFHWMYNVVAASWIVYGVAFAILLGYASIWWKIDSSIRDIYDNLPQESYDQAWSEVADYLGGYFKILMSTHPVVRFSMLGSVLFGLFLFASMLVNKATTEIAVTNHRLIYKKGLIARHVGELGVASIEGVGVRQSILGRIFGYGRVTVRGMGVGEVMLPPIENPVVFRRAIQDAQMQQAQMRNAPLQQQDS